MTAVSYSRHHFVEIVRQRAVDEGKKRAYTFLEFRPEARESHITYEELDLQARAIAARLSACAEPGDRALLLFRPGLEFISAFLGCLYAGVIGVPANIARQGHGVERLKQIMKDANPCVILSTTSVKRPVQLLNGGEQQPEWVYTDELPTTAAGWQMPEIRMKDIAFLQYSSGSTGEPKGIMVSHGNLAHHGMVMQKATGATHESCMVSWLPAFHDMGLILGILQPLYGGFPGVLMSPESFGEDPFYWLKTISDHWADISAAPNFAYEMSLRRVSEEQRRTLDLSHWRVAINGAESVRPRTIADFTAAFSDCGFRRDAFVPSYGLAEGTLAVTSVARDVEPIERSFSAEDLEYNMAVPADINDSKTRKLVGCGTPVLDQTVAIADPETCCRKTEMEVGEIWVSGPSVAQGYWSKQEETESTFQAHLATGEGPFLRTGDLGFICEGQLFICGRLKDLILIRGRNHHAPDIEATVEHSHPAVRPSCGAAFAIDADNEERLVLVQELDRAFKINDPRQFDEVVSAIRQAIAERHEIQVYSVVLIRHGTMPKTSSGKVRRRECRARYLEGRLTVRAAWDIHTKPEHAPNAAGNTQENTENQSAMQEIGKWLTDELVTKLGCDPSALSPQKTFTEIGLNGNDMIKLVRAMELHFQCMLPMTLLTEFPTLQALAGHLYIVQKKKSGPTDASSAARSFTGLVQHNDSEPIAIIGLGCRFPGAHGIQQFWKVLCDGVDAVTEVPSERWNIDELYDPNPLAPGKMNTRWGGFLKDIDLMDRNFFEISVREAVRMDPQHRLVMEVAWESLEDAGLRREQLTGSQVGVFIGISSSDYAQMQMADPNLADAYGGLGSALTIAASRVSHFLNLRGPAIAVDTACSSSLSAVHLACASLRSGECELALAGGVNILLAPVTTMFLTKAGMMSPDGRCKAFDSRANGYVRSEGAGVAVLKPLSRALADGDPIYAVIRGIASNQDGHSSGLAAPNGEAQEAVIRAACRNAKIAPCDLDYVEAHGTGTPVGDPIEANALGAVLGQNRALGDICPIGSVKTNIGHAESAAGMASLIKTALVLKNRIIPPSLHFIQANPNIPFASMPIQVQTTLAPMPSRLRPLLAGVNGFGVGGTNVHVVLEEAPCGTNSSQNGAHKREAFVLPLSGSSPASLKANARAMADRLRQADADKDLSDIAFTLGARRNHLKHRLAAVGANAGKLADAFAAYSDDGYHAAVTTGVSSTQSKPRLAFIFSGQGSQWLGMGRDLLEREAAFRQTMEECDRLLQQHTGWSLIQKLKADEANSRMDETEVAQPAIFAIQVALAALWRSWGVIPDAVAGHSVGEVAAAHVAGALTLPEAIKLIAHRARLMQKATGLGKMASIELPASELEQLLNGYGDRLSIAAVNSPSSVVISGEAGALANLIEILNAQGITTVPLPVNYAFHSAQMEPFKHELIAALHNLDSCAAEIPMFSTVTGKWRNGHAPDAHYWGANLRQPVLFSQAIEAMARDGVQIFMEIGPHPVVSGSISRGLQAAGCQGVVISNLRRHEEEQQAILTALGTLYANGYPCDWKTVYPSGSISRSLPSYQWDRQRYWLDGKSNIRRNEVHPVLGSRLPVAQPVWQNKVDVHAMPYLRGYQVNRRALLPSGHLAGLALQVATEAGCGALIDVKFHSAIDLPQSETASLIQAMISTETGGERCIQIFSRPTDSQDGGEAWKPCLIALSKSPATEELRTPRLLSLQEIKKTCREQFSGSDFYRNLELSGIYYDELLRIAEHAWAGERVALFQMKVPDAILDAGDKHGLQAAVLESASQACRIVYGLQGGQLDLSGIERLSTFASCNPSFYVYVSLREIAEENEEFMRVDVWIANEDGEVAIRLEGVQFTPRQDEPRLGVPTDPRDWLYDIAWQPAPHKKKTSAAPGQGSWVVLADASGCGDQIVDLLRIQGQRCVTVRHGEDFQQLSPEAFVVSPSNLEHMRRVLSEALPSGTPPCKGVLHLWSMDSTPPEMADADSIAQDQGLSLISLLYTLQAIAMAEFHKPPRLLAVTRGAQQIDPQDPPVSFSQSTVFGFGKVITLEHPELRCCRIDVSAALPAEEVASLAQECLANDDEDQVAFRGKDRYVARLVRHVLAGRENVDNELRPLAADRTVLKTDLFQLEFKSGENPSELMVRRGSRQFPRAGEVEIRVSAASLDARDIARNTGGSEPAWISSECTGAIVTLGSRVTGYQPGERVLALSQGCMSPYLTIPTCAIVSLPETITDEQAASSARPFIAAFHALHKLARVAEGDTILIHGAGRGTGLAAVQIAKWLGANVLATVEHSCDRQLLEQWGVSHIFDAGSLNFRREALKLTQGQGVQTFLNCVSGVSLADFYPVLKVCGHCIDAAEDQSSNKAAAGRMRLSDNISFCAINLDELQAERPDYVRGILQSVMSYLRAGTFVPLPVQAFAAEQIIEAVQQISTSENTTRVAITLPDSKELAARDTKSLFRDNGTYVITGGLGGLGLAIALRMVQRGACHMVLVGRSAPSPSAQEQIGRLRDLGANVKVVSADVSLEQDVRRILGVVKDSMPPLRGVIHAAGVLGNGLLVHQEEARFRSVMPAKVIGAWHLHNLTRELPLDFFVLFSSLASLIGSHGQSNYSAANAFLDGLATYRRAKGMTALSIGWGPWSEVGMASDAHNEIRLKDLGMGMLAPEKALDLFELLLQEPGGHIGAISMDWQLWSKAFPSAADSPFVSSLIPGRKQRAHAASGKLTCADLEALEQEARIQQVEQAIHKAVCQTLRLDPTALAMSMSLSAVGLDSIVALELKSRIEAALDVVVHTPSLLKGPTIQQLAGHLLAQMFETPEQSAEEERPSEASAELQKTEVQEAENLLNNLDDLSEEEVSSLLARMTASAGD